MGMKPVVEPAGNDKYKGAKSIERAEVTDTLLFPHVDSCLAIVFILEDGAVVGAHVGQYGGPGFSLHQPDTNATEAVAEMKKLAGGKKILGVFTLGERRFNRSAFLADVTKNPVNVYEVPGGGLDIDVDPKLRVITTVWCLDKSKTAAWKFADLHS